MAQGKFSKPRTAGNSDTPLQQVPIEPDAPPTQETQALPVPPAEPVQPVRPAPRRTPEPPDLEERISVFLEEHRGAVIGVVCAVALLLVISVAALFLSSRGSDPYGEKMLNNVTVGGVNIGGMTREEARRILTQTAAQSLASNDMTVLFPESTLTLSPASVNVHLDVEAAVDAAYAYGRQGSRAEQQKAYQASLTGNHIVGLLPYMTLNQDYIRQQLQAQEEYYRSLGTETTYALEGTMPPLDEDSFNPDAPCQTLKVTIGTPGYTLDTGSLLNQILDAYSLCRFQVDGKKALTAAQPAQADAIAIYQALYIPPEDASIDPETNRPTPAVYGYGFDLDELQLLLRTAVSGETLRLPMKLIEPGKQSSDLNFRDVLGSCQTSHDTHAGRNENLRLVCEALNGTVLQPGQTLSFNEAVGQRSAQKGYKPAPGCIGTDSADIIGGGVCQCASTLYLCAMLADLEIVDRTGHELPLSYTDPGMDAAVSWGGADLVIRNSTAYPVKILAETDAYNVKLQLLGIDTRSWYIRMDYETTPIPRETEYREEEFGSGYTEGQVLETGNDGSTVYTYRCRYDRTTGVLLARNYETSTFYPMKPRILVRLTESEAAIPTETQIPTEPEEEPETLPDSVG